MPAVAKPLTDFPLFTPPPRRWAGPIVDAHMHAKDLASIDPYWAIAEQPYGVRYAVPIVDLNTGLELRAKFGARVQPAIWGIQPRSEKLSDLVAGRNAKEEYLEKVAAAGFRIVKLWFTPRFHQMWNLRLDDPLLDFFFDRISRLRLAVLIHVADPDYWFAHRINDLEEHGSKAEQYLQWTARLDRHPDVIFQGAHFAGHPEDFEHLASLLERHPNLYLDTSATKWIAREVGRQPAEARDFIIHHADRILFGTDLVANPEREKEGKREHYATRFYVHQLLWEGEGVFDSPIEDEDSPGPVRFHGLNLPVDVLGKIYWANAAHLYGFEKGVRTL